MNRRGAARRPGWKPSTPASVIYYVDKFVREREFGYSWPVEVARELNLTWIEVYLALLFLAQRGRVQRRKDGRWFAINQAEAR